MTVEHLLCTKIGINNEKKREDDEERREGGRGGQGWGVNLFEGVPHILKLYSKQNHVDLSSNSRHHVKLNNFSLQ